MKADYTITLTQKVRKEVYSRPSTSFSFNDLDKDLPVIYRHFSFLSYLSPSCGVTILHRKQLEDRPEVTVDYFHIKKRKEDQPEKLYLFEVSKDEYSGKVLAKGQNEGLRILCAIGTEPSLIPENNRITVTFTTETT